MQLYEQLLPSGNAAVRTPARDGTSRLALSYAKSWMRCSRKHSPKGNQKGCGRMLLICLGIGVRVHFGHILYPQNGG